MTTSALVMPDSDPASRESEGTGLRVGARNDNFRSCHAGLRSGIQGIPKALDCGSEPAMTPSSRNDTFLVQ